MLERDFDLKDPESKTLFYREIAKKLCSFSVDVERENYLEAVADKYHIGFENLRRLVGSYAMQTGVDKPPERPRSGVRQKIRPRRTAGVPRGCCSPGSWTTRHSIPRSPGMWPRRILPRSCTARWRNGCLGIWRPGGTSRRL